ncbi:MAG: DNA translocase FtsK 4TM domain-containing protein [Candidatus Magasanikbacteria bacterium]|nr:DNA translocase FtsK 4TM domain-containing protein [Candidatus Magasanikbacteria bacterium]
MARLYRHYQKRQRDDKPKINLNPEVSQGLLAILLFVVAGLSILSFFNMAGVAGIFIDSTLALIFGSVRYVFPLMLITIAVLLIKDLEYNYRHTHTIGAILFFLSFNGLIHIQKPLADLVSEATQGYAGGLFGLALSWPLLRYVGYWGGLMILIALLLVSIIFLFNTTLAQLVEINKKFFMMLGWGGQQIVAFFASFKNNKLEEPVKFSIKGEYAYNESEEENEDEERVFNKKAIDDQEEESEEVPQEEDEPEAVVQKEKIVIEKPDYSDFKLPAVDLLFTSKSKPTSGDIKGNAETIRDTFQNFGIEVDMGEVRVGPTVTQYSMKPAKGVKLTRITTLSNDLALALAAHPIRIEAPIPGQSLVGIEVPNEKVAMVTLKELLESPEFKERGHNLMIALGKDVAGKVWFADLPKMPHLLVAGSTGSGKTVCINTIILSLLYQNTPETLRFIMVDPKRVELTLYNGIPHLLTPVITDPAKTVNALKWTIGEMERRFDTLAQAGCRDIISYNKTATDKLPYIVFIIDELADLMATAASEVEAGIIRVAQMARAVGIHLIVATQRPSVEVITGLMKANIPARIAFSVASLIDSRTILDCSGAEKLLGRGDMLYLTADLSKPKRVQGAFVSEEEMKRVVKSIKGDNLPTYDESIVSKNGGGGHGGTVNLFGGASDDQDSLFDDAKRCVIESGKASASLLQRRLKVGYARAARLLDELEEAGIVGAADGAKPRDVFTEHLSAKPGIHRPQFDEEIPEDEQTLDTGGTVFDSPKHSEPSDAENIES